ncbi:MAG: RnfH family protein [Magnetococcales bacterium]|nr:RnfH family protein [Magnetococcales bacterium]
MKVSVAYAEPTKQMVLDVDVDEGASAVVAIERSGILAKIPQIDLAENKIGIFGKLIKPEQVLSPGDRLEIYRPALGKPPKKDRAAKEVAAEE